MSNFLKIMAILAVILVGIGLLGAVVLVASGNNTILLPNITKDGFSYHSFSFNFNQYGFHEEVKRPEKPAITDSTALKDLDGEITDILLQLGAVDFRILQGEKNAFDATEFNGSDLKVDLSNGKLTITTGDDNLDFMGNDFTDRTLILYLNSTDFDSVAIEGGASSFSSDVVINCKDFSLDAGIGSYEMLNITATDSSSVTVGLGDAVLSGTFLNDVNLDCGMGNLEMTVNGKQSNFGYEIDGGMGSIDFGTDSSGGIGFEKTKFTDAKNFFTISCGMGSIDIDFTN